MDQINLEAFHCPNCKEIPHLKMLENFNIEIMCKCYERNESFSLPENDPKVGKSLHVSDLWKFQRSVVPLHFFIPELKKKNPIPFCNFKKSHDRIQAERYCTECNKWLCLNCLYEHSKTHRNHIVIRSNGTIINSVCENKNCVLKGKIEYYCKECKLHFCGGKCIKDHNKNYQDHNVIDLKNYLTKEDLFKLDFEIQRLENILTYIRSIKTTFEMGQKILNYNMINNVKNLNSTASTYKFTNVIEEEKINKREEGSNSLIRGNSDDEDDFSNKKSIIVAQYEIKKGKTSDESKNYSKILGDNYNLLTEQNCQIFIDKKTFAFKKSFPDKMTGKHEVEFLIKENENLSSLKLMFENCLSLSQISFTNFHSNQLTTLENAFLGCKNLTSIDLSPLNLSKVATLKGLFSGCESMNFANLSNLKTSNVTDMSYLFYGCYNLKSIDLTGINTENVSDMKGMFWKCQSLEKLDLSSFTTENATDMRCMFSDCSSIKTLNLSNFETSSLNSMENMFYRCSSLTTLKIENFNTTNVTSFEEMFYQCSSLNYISLLNFYTSNVTNMQGMFSGCKNLQTLNLTSFNTSNVTNMNQMFQKCESLVSLDLDNFKTSKVDSMEYMFAECFNLCCLKMNNFDVSNATNINHLFSECSCLINLYIPNNISFYNINLNEKVFFGCNRLDKKFKEKLMGKNKKLH